MEEELMELNIKEIDKEKVPETVAVKELTNFPALRYTDVAPKLEMPLPKMVALTGETDLARLLP
jgi:hypothetical protein